MKLPVSIDAEIGIQTEFRHVPVDAAGDAGKVHLTLNGHTLCGMLDSKYIAKHPTLRDTVGGFLKNPCIMCYERLDGQGRKEALKAIAAAKA